jgi:hypothetical protein
MQRSCSDSLPTASHLDKIGFRKRQPLCVSFFDEPETRAFEFVGLFARINRGNVLSLSELLGCVNSRQEGKVTNGF